jgi:hypothetical protein
LTDSIEFSVRDLIPNPDIAAETSRSARYLHQITQARLARKYPSFVAEAEIRAQVETSHGSIPVSGRLDGFRKARKGIILYEIKAVPGKAKHWLGSDALKWARIQLQFYAALSQMASGKPWTTSPVRDAILVLAGSDGTLAEENVDISLGAALLTQRLDVMLAAGSRHRKGAEFGQSLQRFAEQDALTDRPLQRQVLQEIGSLRDQKNILLALPPGAGKTRITLRLGLLKASRLGVPLYWITEKAAGREEVIRELERWNAAGIHFRTVWKTAPARLCRCGMENSNCDIRSDTQGRLFSEGLPNLSEQEGCSPDLIAEYAREHHLCPHEVMKSFEPDADVIIADLNYLLQRSSLHRRSAVIILDEVQNLAARIVENSQISFAREALRSLKPLLPRTAQPSLQFVLNASNWTADDLEVVRRHWIQLADSLESESYSESCAAKVQIAAGYWSQYAEHYRLAWCRQDGGASLIGTLLDPTPIAETLLNKSVAAYALSGSLPASDRARSWLFPLYNQFAALEVMPQNRPPVRIIPLLTFKHPLTQEDHATAMDALCCIREKFASSVAVFGQNRASNELISWQMRARGFTTWLDIDIREDWSTVEFAKPDFVFFALGGRLSESVNPPAGLFTAAAVLSPGYTVTSLHEKLRIQLDRNNSADYEEDADYSARITDSVSRIIQAAGRLQRSPDSAQPVFLLNRDFTRPEFMREWPRSWFSKSAHELVYPSLEDALQSIDGTAHAK